MGQNFIECDRETAYLMPPSLREWLPQDELAWFILDAVAEMDLSKFYGKYRADGWGRSAYDPGMMVSLLLYAYSNGVLSSRKIERACHVDVAFRIIAANRGPDYSTICRFRAENEFELQRLFTQVLRLCAKAGLVKVGVIALDGTKMKAAAALAANRTHDKLAAEVARIFEQAKAKDEEEDRLYGPDKRGDELPEELRSRDSRLKRLKEAKARLEQEAAAEAAEQAAKIEKRRAQEKATGKPAVGRPPNAPNEGPAENARANVTDPESRVMKTGAGHHIQGYNAQIAVTKEQIIVAAEVTQSGGDRQLLNPMLKKAEESLKASGIKQKIRNALADAGYWSNVNLKNADPKGPQLWIATTKEREQRKTIREQTSPRGRIPKGLPPQELMARKLLSAKGRKLYKLRRETVEPVFGQIKSARGCDRFLRRRLHATVSEWSLYCSTHNLLKLWRSGKAKFGRTFGRPALAYA
jgi:transposase